MIRTLARGDVDSRALLEARARELARPAAASIGQVDDGALVVLEIRLADERVGIPLAQIVEICRPTALSALPGARAPAVGVMAWRGRVLTVLDLAHARVGPPTLGEAVRVVVVGADRAAFGILADEVDDVRSIAVGDLRPSDDPSSARAGIVHGVTRDALGVLDTSALLQRLTSTT